MVEEFKRPDPDQLLKEIQAESTTQERQRGYLKVFLGYIAGVGKTYRMLHEAQSLAEKGEDVTVAIVETHGRQETEALLAGLEMIPRRTLEYGGLTLTELDLERVLQRKPKYVIVDEFAHTNVPGVNHQKRYQDVEDLLRAGVSVYTTLNIQHVESLNDVVYQITGVRVKETLPDTILMAADKIELVDLTPEELLQRLQEGKVYIPEKAQVAARHFFKPVNLLALREAALRYAANRVDDRRLAYQELRGTTAAAAVSSKLLVSISASPSSEYLIRVTQRFADDLQAEWFAVYVESPQQGRLSNEDRLRLERHCRLSEELGGKVVKLSGTKVADAILDFARSKNVGRIIIGFSKRSRWHRLWRGAVVDDLIHQSDPIQVLVISGKPELTPQVPSKRQPQPQNYLRAGLLSMGSVAFTVLICLLLKPIFELYDILLVFILPILASSLTAGILGGVLASLLAVGCFNFFFVPPLFTFNIYDVRFVLTFCTLTFVGSVISVLVGIIKRQNETAKQREKFITALYDFNKNLFSASDLTDLGQRITREFAEIFNCEVLLLRPDRQRRLQIAEKLLQATEFAEREISIATWVFEHQQPAGVGTKTFAASKWHYLPLHVKQGTLGVLAVTPGNAEAFITYENEHLLASFGNVAALAIANFTR